MTLIKLLRYFTINMLTHLFQVSKVCARHLHLLWTMDQFKGWRKQMFGKTQGIHKYFKSAS